MNINMYKYVGDFGEDKDIAALMREKQIRPNLDKGKHVTLDFDNVHLVTQSFIHALISDILRKGGENILDILEFKNASQLVRGIVSTVVQYSLDTAEDSPSE
jgi:hypothetical protein